MASNLWQDKDIRFDVPNADLRMGPGEKVIDQLDFVEDTKGNGGDKGKLIMTNLRIIWHSLSVGKVNMSIGFSCIINISSKMVVSTLRGTAEALHILTKAKDSRLEFIFTNLIPGNSRHFTSAMGVYKAYMSSRMYRELKLRGCAVQRKEFNTLPLEHVIATVEGVWNLSSDQGNLGKFIISNVRLVWFAAMNEAFNVSVPHIQIISIKIRDSKFGPALVVESSINSGGYILGFHIDPSEKLHKIAHELAQLHKIHSKNPELGVHFVLQNQPPLPETPSVEEIEEPEFEDSIKDLSSNLVMYGAGGELVTPRPLTFFSEIGLAMEQIRDGFTLTGLWEVIPS
nr:PREDICTED: Bardet-Biedl syndrome 5 protein homolog isoform X1 [Bemisia tabaci]